MRRADVVSLVAGLAVAALGALALAHHEGLLDLRFEYAGPAVFAAVGVVLLAAGLSRD